MSDSPDTRLWSVLQFPYGYSDAIDKIGTTASPLLAGFAFALIGLIVGQRDALAQPDLALLLLVAAGIALISSVQLNFTARKYHFSPSEYFDLQRLAAEDGIPLGTVKAMARDYLLKQRRWTHASRFSYNIGVTVLFFGVAATLVPTAGIAHMDPLRAVAVALPVAASLVEAVLILREAIEHLRFGQNDEDPAG